ncbi:hypothetical protein PIB30_015113 [Stylosanthes scabra]|uniref:Secreted protein n=1 Tax=Stylosanthes scabra TaxID=79078 RepID=A0ABU6R786_9FABA|nr:hypothetical protein [Stylosanthes scabra]
MSNSGRGRVFVCWSCVFISQVESGPKDSSSRFGGGGGTEEYTTSYLLFKSTRWLAVILSAIERRSIGVIRRPILFASGSPLCYFVLLLELPLYLQ